MKFAAEVTNVGFLRSLEIFSFLGPFEKRGFLGNGQCVLACGALA